jgi:DNA-binding CsgD family transcriptional regulator
VEISGLDRVLLFQVDAEALSVRGAHFRANPEWASDCFRFAMDHPIQLQPNRFETEVLRRRVAGLALSAMRDPQCAHPITSYTSTTSYVSAPILHRDELYGVINGDTYYSRRPVDVVDRDILAAYAAKLSSLFDRTLDPKAASRVDVAKRIRREHRRADALPTARNPRDHNMFRLTPREQQVVGLMATGATNKDIAAQLIISEETVKSHVRSILRKSGMPNRTGAVGYFWNPDTTPITDC